ncbi:MAG TPA: glycosyltransferase [Candidatus Saccharimonadales bacterium]
MAGAQKDSLSMKVLLITGSYPPLACGVGDYSCNLAKSLAALPDIRVSVLTSIGGGKDHDKEDGVEIFPIIKSWRIAEAIKVVKVIWRISPDIVHIQYPTQGYKDELLPWLLPIIAFLMGNKVVQTWHEIYINRVDRKLLLKAIVPGGLVVVRPQYREQLHPKVQKILRNTKISFIRNASAIRKRVLSEREQIEEKRKYVKRQKRLVVFFGFLYPPKGVELLFDIADPDLDQIVIAGQFGGDGDYNQKIIDRASMNPWAGKVTITGFLSSDDVAALLAVADAVILPFRTGGGEWNTSIHSAVLQGAFVLTTSQSSCGFDKKHNVYYSEIDNIQEMKSALSNYAGRRREYDPEIDRDEWLKISTDHYSLYEALLAK